MLAADAPAPPSSSHGRSVSSSCSPPRATLRDLGREHDELVNSVHRDEMARTQQRMRIEQLEERALEELGMDVDGLVNDYGPTTLVPSSGEVRRWTRIAPDRCRSCARSSRSGCRPAERALAMLGRVNPLALEEFSAMEERHKFLTEQLEDLAANPQGPPRHRPRGRRRGQQVFTEAYADVAQGLRLDVRAAVPRRRGPPRAHRPRRHAQHRHRGGGPAAGKKVKRLSLLSGGERSLVAVAFLVALFKARPSPFYILDEVEAALDDTNLGPAPGDLRGAARELPAARHHPPEAHDGGRRRALRRHDARRRRLDGDLASGSSGPRDA